MECRAACHLVSSVDIGPGSDELVQDVEMAVERCCEEGSGSVLPGGGSRGVLIRVSRTAPQQQRKERVPRKEAKF